MNIDKYINNTKRKTKKAKLPALSTMTPIMPDGAAGIATFNSSFGGGSMSEDLSSSDINKVKSNIESEAKVFMIEKGFDEDELDKVLEFEFIEGEYIFTINVKADLTISSLRELADALYDIVADYDENAYFDISANNTISVDLEMKNTLSEQLQRLDRIGFDRYCEDYDLEALYESTKTKLDNQDRAKLQKFLQTTDDPEAVNTYMKGLLLEEDDVDSSDDYELYDDYDEVDVDESEVDKVITEQDVTDLSDAYQQLHDLFNQVVLKANKAGVDALRSMADSALGALDDVLYEIEDMQLFLDDEERY